MLNLRAGDRGESPKCSSALFGLVILLAQGCAAGKGDTGSGNGGAGGSSNPASGGQNGSGGQGSGGSSATGGSQGNGGSQATGGSQGNGGASATGGISTTTGGSPATGGISTTGGARATGGVSTTGGVSATGGVSTTGGVAATREVAATGGTSATGGTTGPVAGGVLITPDATGHVAAASNSLGINGNWFSYSDTASTISPGTGSFANVGGKMCTKGSLVASSSAYGGIGFELNDTGGQQPFNLTKNGVKGFSFVLSGTLPTAGIRFAYGKKKDDNVFFATVSTIGQNTVLASVPPLGQGSWEVKETWDPTMTALIEFQIPGSATAATPFDFCVESLTAVTQ